MQGIVSRGSEQGYLLLREGVGWGLITITPFNLTLLFLLNRLLDVPGAYFSTEMIYLLSASSALSVIGMVMVAEETGRKVQERQRRQIKRPEGAICTVCGAVMLAGQTKCQICGSSPLKDCPKCSTLMSITAVECPRCGYRRS